MRSCVRTHTHAHTHAHPQVRSQPDLSTALPVDPLHGQFEPQLVVGSLDLNIGRAVPVEELRVSRLGS